MPQWMMIRTLFNHIPMILKLLLAVIGFSIFFGGIVHIVEPDLFPTWFDGVWWALVTVSTVGYGDYVPASTFTRLLALILIFVGVGFMTLLVTTFAGAAFSEKQGFREGKVSFLGEGHIVIIGWNERSKHTIEHLQQVRPHTSIVLIDETLTKLPTSYKKVHFVKGNSSEDWVLKQANIGLAETVLITPRYHGSEFQADAFSILTTLAVKSQNPDAYIIVEILTNEQMINAKRAGADECIESTSLTGSVLVTSLLHHQMSAVFEHLLTFNQVNRFKFKQVEKTEVGKAFSTVLHSSYESGILVIGLKRDEQVILHPSASFPLQKEDELIVMTLA